MAQSELYEFQPARAVSLEAYFHGRFSAFSRLDRVQEQIIGRFPKLFVPHALNNDAIALRPYQMRSDDQREAFAVAINQVSYVSYQYPGHKKFIPDAVALIESALEVFGVTELQRVVYRYANEVMIERDEDGSIPIHDVLRLNLGAAGEPAPRLRDLNLAWTRPWEYGDLATVLFVERRDETNVLHLGIAAEHKPAGGVSELATFAARAHERAQQHFESVITDAFRASIRGERQG